MNRRRTKLTAAAVTILAASMTVYFYAGSFPGSTEAFAASDVIAATKQAQWVHITQQWTDTNNVPAEKLDYWNGREFWQSIDPYRTISVGSSGDIEFIDSNSKEAYHPESNNITVIHGRYPEQDSPAFMQEVWLNSVSDLEKSGAKVEYSDGMYEGRPAKIIHVDYTKESGWYEEITIVADAKTCLARKITVHQRTVKGVSGTILMLLDYPSTGPRDIYEAGARRDAKITIADDFAEGR